MNKSVVKREHLLSSIKRIDKFIDKHCKDCLLYTLWYGI